MLSRIRALNHVFAGRPGAALFLLVLCFGCTDGKAQPATEVYEVYAANRSKILDCPGVCEVGGWYFCSVSVPAQDADSMKLNRAKLEAMHRIQLFIEDPESYRRLEGGFPAGDSRHIEYRDTLEVHVLESGRLRNRAAPRLGVTVGARPTQASR